MHKKIHNSEILNLKDSQWIWPSKNIQIFPHMVEERSIFINSIAIYGDWRILNIEMCPGLNVREGNSITTHNSQSLSTWKYYKSQAAIKWNCINTSKEFRCNKERLGFKLRNFNFIILGAWLHSTNYIKISVKHRHTTPTRLHTEAMA